MVRLVLVIVSAMSFILCMAASAAWVRSYRRGDVYEWQPTSSSAKIFDRLDLGSGQGRLSFYRERYQFSRPITNADAQNGALYSVQNPLYQGYHPESPIEAAQHFWPQSRHGQFVKYDVYIPDNPVDRIPGLLQRWEWHTMACPYWFLVISMAIFPAWQVVALLMRRTAAHGANCRKCGYDLRATPERCPECGTMPQKVLKA